LIEIVGMFKEEFEANKFCLFPEYSVLLNGRGVNPKVETDIYARGFLYFQKRHLHYALHISG